MWQTIIVLILLAWALVYVIRHFVAVYRSETTTCSGCSTGCCGAGPVGKKGGCDVEDGMNIEMIQKERHEEDHFVAGKPSSDF